MVDPSVIGSIGAAAVASVMMAGSSHGASGVLGWASNVTSSVGRWLLLAVQGFQLF